MSKTNMRTRSEAEGKINRWILAVRIWLKRFIKSGIHGHPCWILDVDKRLNGQIKSGIHP